MNSASTSAPRRLLSLDVYRGAVMLLLALNGFGFAALARDTDSAFLDWLGSQTSHPAWISQINVVGFALWDMIQPAFMFIVGVAVPYSFAKRQSLGEGRVPILRHGMGRALLLVLLGVFLQSRGVTQTNWLFTNVLCQIGLGYGLLLLMAGRSYRTQIIVGGMMLAASWLIYALHPIGDPAAFAAGKRAAQGVSAGTLPGFFGHWSIHANAGATVDRWFLNLFPRSEPFVIHPGGYHTINFIPAAVTMLMGMMCGQLLRDERRAPAAKLKRLALAGALCLALGVLLGATVCPIVKRLWTPSWTLFSGAYVIWLLALFYWVIDVRGWKGWTFPCLIAGMNPLTMFVMGSTLHGWVVGQLHIHLPAFLFAKPLGHVVDATLCGVVLWFVCYGMYRRKVFLRL